MRLVECMEKDISLLAILNKELIEDEVGDNIMSIQELDTADLIDIAGRFNLKLQAR